jgi:hypothetical protein
VFTNLDVIPEIVLNLAFVLFNVVIVVLVVCASLTEKWLCTRCILLPVLELWSELNRKLVVYIFPSLFSEKKLLLEDNKESTEILFMDKRQAVNNVQVDRTSTSNTTRTRSDSLFSAMSVMVIYISAFGIFRYFPVTASTKCMEVDTEGNTLYCYNYNHGNYSTTSNDPPLDCNNLTNISENDIICYTLSANLGTCAAVAVGLYHLAAKSIVVTVYATLLWCKLINNCCSKHKIIAILCHVLYCLFWWLLLCVALFTVIYPFLKATVHGIGESIYLSCQVTLFGTLALFIPCLLNHLHAQIDIYDQAYKYNYLATCDGPKEAPESATDLERTPLLDINTAHLKHKMPETSESQL